MRANTPVRMSRSRADVLAARHLREGGRAAESDDGNPFTGGGDGARDGLLLEQVPDAHVEGPRIEREHGARADGEPKPFAT